MAENQPRQRTVDDVRRSLEAIATLSELSSSYQSATEGSRERGRYVSTAATLISGQRPQDRDHSLYENELGNMMSPDLYQVKVNDQITAIREGLGDDYKTYLPEIRREILEKLNSWLEGAKEKSEALDRLLPLLRLFHDIKEPTQEDADRAFEARARSRSRIQIGSFAGRGDPGQLFRVQYRTAFADYVDEHGTRDGEKSYTINEGMLDKLLEDPRNAAILYTAQIKEQENPGREYRQAA